MVAEKFIGKYSISRQLNLLKLFSITASAQIVIQAISLLSGVIIIRLLPTTEYAFYTLVNTMLGTMTILADGGIATGVLIQGRKVWQDKEHLGVILATGFDLRRKFAIGSLTIAIPILMYLLLSHGASWGMAILIVVSLVPAFNAALSDTILEIAPKLNQDINSLQKNQIWVSVYRFFLTSITIFLFPLAYLAILSSGLPRTWGNFQLRKISNRYANANTHPNSEVKKEILKTVKRVLPGAIYFCLSGQITIWLISIFGSTKSLAQVGALSRLTMVLGLFNTVFNTVLVPRFARIPDIKKIVIKRFLQFQVVLFLIGLVIIGLVSLFPNQILWIIGSKYSNLSTEIILMTVGSCVGLVSQTTNQLLSSRGIIVPPIIFIPIIITVQVLTAFTFDLSRVSNILIYGITTTASIYFIRVLYLFITLSKYENKKED